MPEGVVFALIGDASSVVRAARMVGSCPSASVGAIFSDELADRPARFQGQPVASGSAINTDEGRALLRSSRSDWLLSVGNFTHLISRATLAIFDDRTVNLHLGLLPEYAGRHAYQWAIRNGERETGSTLHRITGKSDAGDILAVHREVIGASDTGLSIYKKCLAGGFVSLAGFLNAVARGEPPHGETQDLLRRRLYREAEIGDGRIDWTKPAAAVRDFVRAANFQPFSSPSYTAWFEYPPGVRREVFEVRVEDEARTDEPPSTILECGSDLVIQCGTGRARVTRMKEVCRNAAVER